MVETLLLALVLICLAGLVLLTLLVFALVRRVSELGHGGHELPPDLDRLPDGATLPTFDGRRDPGGSWSSDELDVPTMLSVLSSTCSACVDAARELRATADRRPGTTIVVLYGDDATKTAHLDDILGDRVTKVRVEESVVTGALRVQAMPFHYVIDGSGRVARASIALAPALDALDAALPSVRGT